MTNESLSFWLQLISLFIVFLFAVVIKRKKLSIGFGVCFMFVVNFMAQFLLMGGGPGGCLGFLALPAIGAIIAWATCDISKNIYEKNMKNKSNQDT